MQALSSYLNDAWTRGDGKRTVLVNPATDVEIAEVHGASGLGDALAHARNVGGPALRALGWKARAELLGALA